MVIQQPTRVTVHESGWVANQVAPALEDSFTVAWPTTIFEVSNTLSDSYVWQGVGDTLPTSGIAASITKGWVKEIRLKNPQGADTSNWETSIVGAPFNLALSGVNNISIMHHFNLTTFKKPTFRLKANLEVGTYNDASIDVVATDIQGIEHTETINLQGSVTKPPSIFTPSTTQVAAGYEETEGPSAEKTITITTKFLSSLKWKSSGTISWEYFDTTWKPLPTNYVTILNKPFQANQTHSTQESLTIKVRLKAGLEVPNADDMDTQIESANFNNVITFEALSSHGDDVTAGKQVALNGTVTEYPNGCANYGLSFATTGGKVTVATNGGDGYGVSINGLESAGHLCFDEPKRQTEITLRFRCIFSHCKETVRMVLK